LEISGGTYEASVMFNEATPDSTQRREAFFLDYAEKARAYTSVPLMVTGGFRTRAGMSLALEDGGADVIGLARPLAVEPDLPARLISGAADAALPISLRTGWRSVDDMVVGGWYQAQIQRMSEGLAPDPGFSRLRAVWHYLTSGERKVRRGFETAA